MSISLVNTQNTLIPWNSRSDFKKFENGLNENLGLLFFNITSAIIDLVVGFVYGWKLSLVILAVSPLMILSAVLMTKVCLDFKLFAKY